MTEKFENEIEKPNLIKVTGYKVLTKDMKPYIMKNMEYKVGEEYSDETTGFYAYKDKKSIIYYMMANLKLTKADVMKKLYNEDFIVYLCEGYINDISHNNSYYYDMMARNIYIEINLKKIKLTTQVSPLDLIEEEDMDYLKEYFENQKYDNYIEYLANIAAKDFNFFTEDFILAEARVNLDENDCGRTLRRIGVMKVVEGLDISNDKKLDLYFDMVKREGINSQYVY